MYIIYKHTCTATGKSYVGQTKELTKRTNAHKSSRSGCVAFRNAISCYGWESFVTVELACCTTVGDANVVESLLISEYNTIAPSGYNLTSGGKACQISELTKRKISESLKGRPKPPRTSSHIENLAARRRGKSYEELYGVERAKELKKNKGHAFDEYHSQRRGKGFNDLFGEDKAAEIRAKMSRTRLTKIPESTQVLIETTYDRDKCVTKTFAESIGLTVYIVVRYLKDIGKWNPKQLPSR